MAGLKVRFITNPVAGGNGGAGAITGAVSRVLSGAEGIFEIKVSAGISDTHRLSAEAADKGYDSVFACGGDAAVNAVASAIVNSEVSLGIIPGGMGGGLSETLNLPAALDEAVSVLVKGRIREIDAGMVGDRFFFSAAGIGLEAAIGKTSGSRTEKGGRGPGALKYVTAAVKERFVYGSVYGSGSVVIRWEEGSLRARPLFLTVANAPRRGGCVAPSASARLDDGLFDVCLVEKAGLAGTLYLTRKFFRGDISSSKQFKMIEARALSVERETAGPVHADGEVFEGEETLEFRLLPRALKVWTF
ncbi:MAG: hypothetical protein HY883_07225 [Deltaproteobacteria bacterium]|nr:hypothetical protein [Deltaproteobacteria bacterium]